MLSCGKTQSYTPRSGHASGTLTTRKVILKDPILRVRMDHEEKVKGEEREGEGEMTADGPGAAKTSILKLAMFILNPLKELVEQMTS